MSRNFYNGEQLTRRGYTPPKGLRRLLDFYDLLHLQHGLRARGVSLSGNNRYVPHQGPKECARRRVQMLQQSLGLSRETARALDSHRIEP